MNNKILIADDDSVQIGILESLIKNKLGFDVISVKNGMEAIYVLKKDIDSDICLVILDINMPDINGIEALESIKKTNPNIPVIMLTSSNEIDNAVTAIKLGAYDFFTKPVEAERLSVSINNALRIKELEVKINKLSKDSDFIKFENIIGYNSGIADIVKTGRKAASADIPILISGETGVGKELFARALHNESLRIEKPFIAINCGAIPENLVESTLFGHEKGSFTGAIAKAIGKFREANGGTIFLDEIGELPLDAQVKMLRVLQQKEVSPVGAAKNFPVDVRIISATNRDLEKEIEAGRFRKDLYFRLNVLEIKIPPIRDRASDISKLVKYFIENFSRAMAKEKKEISSEALEFLACQKWKGNIREIENAVHRAIILSETKILDINDFSNYYNPSNSITKRINLTKNIATNFINLLKDNGLPKTIDEIEQEAIGFNISYNNENITKTAETLGIAKSTLYRKIKNNTKFRSPFGED